MTFPYSDIPAVAQFVLEESYVLGVTAIPARLTFAVDFALAGDHPDYTPPPDDEAYCFRKGLLAVVGVRSLEWGGRGAPPAVDTDASFDFGHIEHLEHDGDTCRLEGDFGRMTVVADGVETVLEPNE